MKLNKFLSVVGVSVMALTPLHSQADETQEISKFMRDFNKNPSAVMNEIPEKVTIKGNPAVSSMFSKKDIESRNYVAKKDSLRETMLPKVKKNGKNAFSEYYANDNPRDLVDDPTTFVDKIAEIDRRNLNSSSLPFQPWSSTYWPLYLGNIAYRYSDPNMPNSDDFNANEYYLLQQHNADALIAENNIDALSPAEKYDLLMNDRAFTLTHSVLGYLGQKNRSRPIEGWEGICHGWAPASYLYNRPVRTVSVFNSQGMQINFFPADIKALSSLLWADAPVNPKIIGGRCNDQNPATDQNGRILPQDCFDSNPGTVHLAFVNQIGINQKGFVFDATYDAQVWNQPVHSYSYVYFNPQTHISSPKSAAVTIPIQSYTQDLFRFYRSAQTVSVVGVQLKVNYIVETAPTDAQKDDPSRDAVKSVTYYYDLELDASGRIIGGEWYQNAHPDFLWTPKSYDDVTLNAIPYDQNNLWSYNYENFIWTDSRSGRSPAPEWTYYAQSVSRQYRLPLDHVVKNLAAWASVDNGQVPENCRQPCVPSPYNWHR